MAITDDDREMATYLAHNIVEGVLADVAGAPVRVDAIQGAVAIAAALAAERHRVLAVRRALIDDDRCACENCIREELGEVTE